MNIYGEKIILRALEPQDNKVLLEMINDPETEKMLGGNSFPVSEHQQNKWYDSQVGQRTVLRCAIAVKENPEKCLGTIILSDIDYVNGTAQIHLKLAGGEARGKGYGTDAVLAMTDYAFNSIRLNCLYADILEYNIPSQKLFIKCGYTLDGILRGRAYKDGKYINFHSYSRLKDDKKDA